MHTYQNLLEEHHADGNVLFFLFLMKLAITHYYDPIRNSFDEHDYKKISEIISSYKVTESLCQIDQFEETRRIFSSPFDVSIIDRQEFFIFFFSFLSKIMIRIDEPRSQRNVKNKGFFPPRKPGETDPDMEKYINQTARGLYVEPVKGLDIPVSYDYFKKIVVGSQVGEWKYIDPLGRVVTFKPPLEIETLTQAEKADPIVKYTTSKSEIRAIAEKLNRPELTRYDGLHFYEDPPGRLILLDDIPSPYTSKSLHKLIVANKIDAIAKQKAKYAVLEQNMKEQGYPYLETYSEYIRFLKTNLKNMTFKGYTLKVKLIFDMFIPSSLA